MTDLNENGLGTDEQERFDALYGTGPAAVPKPSTPGVFSNAGAGLAGIPAGATGAVLSTASFATDTNDVLGNTYADAIGYQAGMQDAPWNQQHQNIEQVRRETSEFYRPDPTTTGFVGNTLYGLTDVLTRVVAGNAVLPGAGVTSAALTSGYERSADLEAEGVDQNTAFGSGAVTAGSLMLGGFGGTVGKTLAARVASGAVTNLAFGTGTRALDSALLDANGYSAQAQQQKWNDAASIASDILIGGAFGFLPHAGDRPNIPADAVDSALTTKNADSVSQAAPGVPVDAASAAAHTAALDTAVGQLVDGQAVAVDPIVRDAQFVDRGETTILRTPAEAGDIIDRRLAALDEVAGNARTKDELRALFSESGELEDLLREQYRNDESGVVVSPENRLSAEDRAFAENRIAEIRTEVEANRSAMWAKDEAQRLRDRLAKNTEDADLVRIARRIHPEQVEPAKAVPRELDADVREALIKEGVRSDELVESEAQPETARAPEPAAIPETAATEPARRTVGERVRAFFTGSDADPEAGGGEAGSSRGAGRRGEGDSGAGAETQRPSGLDQARDAEVELARSAVAQRPDLVLDDGTVASDAIKSADDEFHQAGKTSDAIQAAVACFLQFGEDA